MSQSQQDQQSKNGGGRAGRGCITVTTNTFNLQAPEFYRSLGYDVFSVVSGQGKRYQKYFLSKTL